MELELNALEAPDELQINTVSHNAVNTNADRHKPTCPQCEKPGLHRTQYSLLKRQKSSLKILKIIPETKTAAPIPLFQSTLQTRIITTTKTVKEPRNSQNLFVHPVRHVERQTIPQENATVEPKQPINRFSGKEDRKHRNRSKKEPIKMTRMKLPRSQPNI